MFFQSLGSLWFALSLPAIAILYLLKRTYVDTPVSSHLLWNRALKEQEANRPWQKLRRSLLLLLQLLVAALLVFALMEPGWWRSAAAEGHVVIIMDRSASMVGPAAGGEGSHTPAETKLEAAQAAALEWLDSQETAPEEVTIMTTGSEPAIVALREKDKMRLPAALSAIQPYFGENDGTAALSLADALLRGESSGRIVVITDGQWPDAASAAQLPLHVPVTMVTIADAPAVSRAAIVSFGVKADAGAAAQTSGAVHSSNAGNKGSTHSAVVTLRNDGDKQAVLKANIYADGSKDPAATVSAKVAPKEWESITVSGLPEAAVYKAQLAAIDDRYSADDAMYRFAATGPQQQALLVTSGNLFLSKALSLAGVVTVVADPATFVPDEKTMQSVDWIVLDSVPEEQLQSSSWQELLAAKPVWKFAAPAAAGATTVKPKGSITIKEHPITQYLSFNDVHLARLARQNVTWGEAIVMLGDAPVIYAGLERGRPMLLFTFDLNDSDLPLRTEFPVLVLQAAQWMSGNSQGQLGESLAAAPIEIDFSPSAERAHWELIESAPGLERYAAAPLAELEVRDGMLRGNQLAPTVPGLYKLVEQDAAGNAIASRMLAVTADKREFAPDLVRAGGLELGGAAPASGKSELASALGTASDIEISDSLVRWIAFLILVFLAVEWGVYRRGSAI